jgi:Kef-type K+ transport system membrane component KefB/Trk K+ transport system NAD-binding subunit
MPLEIFTEISIIVVVATLMAGLMRIFKQPTIIGFILTGVLVGPISLNIIVYSTETISVFSKLGIALLLFIVGLGMNPRVIKEVGKTSLITGLGQIVFTSVIGFAICVALGFPFDLASGGYDPFIISIYVAIALTFSSTIIIMKLLSDKHALQSLYGRISVGFLLVQDVVAIALLIAIPYLSGGVDAGGIAAENILFSLLLMGVAALVSIYLIPKMCRFFAKSPEFLFFFSIAWGMGLASLFLQLGFSLEIGALVAGIALSSSPFHYEISSKMRPLRDFFIMIFFILLGSQMALGDVSMFIVPVLLFSAFILIGNPLIVMTLMGLLGYGRKTGFSAGLTVAQISEFSLILIALGAQQGQLPPEIISLVTSVGIITIAGSTYLIHYSERIYPHIAKYLGIFEKRGIRRMDGGGNKTYDAILFGCNRVGRDFLNAFKKHGGRFLAVECDPEVLEELSEKGFNARYGDAGDTEFLDDLDLQNVKIIVSTIPDFDTNVVLLTKVRQVNEDAIIQMVAYRIDDAMRLYDLGASYVIMPHFLGGYHASKMTEKNGFDKEKFRLEREEHIRYLLDRQSAGHEHPSTHDVHCQYPD